MSSTALAVATHFVRYFSENLTTKGAAGLESLYASTSTLSFFDEDSSSENDIAEEFQGTSQIIKQLSSLESIASLKFTSIDAVLTENGSVLISTLGEQLVNAFIVPFVRTFLLVKNAQSYYIKSDIFRIRPRVRNTKKVVMTASEAALLGTATSSISPVKENAVDASSVSAAVPAAETETKVETEAEVKTQESKTVESEATKTEKQPRRLRAKKAAAVEATEETPASDASAQVSPKASDAEEKDVAPVTGAKPKRERNQKNREKKADVKTEAAAEAVPEVTAETKTVEVEAVKPAPVKPASWAAAVKSELETAPVEVVEKTEKIAEKTKKSKTEKSEKVAEKSEKSEKSEKIADKSGKSDKSDKSEKPVERVVFTPELTVYVSAIPENMDYDAFYAAFIGEGANKVSQFTSGRSSNDNATSQIAFVGFETVEETEAMIAKGKLSIHGTEVILQKKRTNNNNRQRSNNDRDRGFTNNNRDHHPREQSRDTSRRTQNVSSRDTRTKA